MEALPIDVSVWFVCKVCSHSFQHLDQFIEHKLAKHVEKSQRTVCIVFEEGNVDFDFDAASNTNSQDLLPNPVVGDPNLSQSVAFSSNSSSTDTNTVSNSILDPCYSDSEDVQDPFKVEVEQIVSQEDQVISQDESAKLINEKNYEENENISALVTYHTDCDWNFVAEDSKAAASLENNESNLTVQKSKLKLPTTTFTFEDVETIPISNSLYNTTFALPVENRNYDVQTESEFNYDQTRPRSRSASVSPVPLPINPHHRPRKNREFKKFKLYEQRGSGLALKKEKHSNNKFKINSDLRQLPSPAHCPICNFLPKPGISLNNHMLTHSSERPFTCSRVSCFASFKTKAGLRQHEKVTHCESRPFKCHARNCSKAFKNRWTLQLHWTTHTGNRPQKCPYKNCSKSFLMRFQLNNHLTNHHSNSHNSGGSKFKRKPRSRPATVNLPSTSKSLTKSASQSESVFQASSLQKNGIRLTISKKKMDLSPSPKPNNVSKTGGSNGPIRLNIIPKIINRDHHDRHHRPSHRNRPKSQDFACRFCKKPQRSEMEQALHERIHTGEKPYQCSVCSKGFTWKQTWRNHEEKCLKLAKAEKSKSSNHSVLTLQRKEAIAEAALSKEKSSAASGSGGLSLTKIRLVNKKREERRNSAFRRRGPSLSQNWKIAIEPQLMPKLVPMVISKSDVAKVNSASLATPATSTAVLEEESLICRVCMMPQRSKNVLIAHERIHTGEKPFSCRFCGRAFAWKQNRRTHEARCDSVDSQGQSQGQGQDRQDQGYNKTPVEDKSPSISKAKSPKETPKVIPAPPTVKLSKTNGKPLKNYTCAYCTKVFYHKGNFLAHVRTHTGEKPFVCDHCNQAFAVKVSLEYHLFKSKTSSCYRKR